VTPVPGGEKMVPLRFGLAAIVVTHDEVGPPFPKAPTDDDPGCEPPYQRRSRRSRAWKGPHRLPWQPDAQGDAP
jgi:hypothetical protein